MKLPFSFGQKKQTTEYFLALLLREETVSVVALGETEQKLRVGAQYTIHLDTPIEKTDFDELLDSIDKAIATVEGQLPENVELHKTIFGVKETWVEDAKIKKEYLAMLKKVSEELELKPIGFLVFSEAIAHLLQEEEGAPVSAILVEIGKQNTAISLMRAGKITETHAVPNGHTITHTVESLLARITSVEILPSRILLFDTHDSSKTAQHLLSHTWNKDLPFLHVPQVTILPPYFDMKAVLFGTAAQLGFTPDAENSLFDSNKPLVTVDGKSSGESQTEKKKSDDNEEELEDKKIAVDNFAPADFGFLIDKDVATEKQDEVHTPQTPDDMQAVMSEIPEIVKEETTGELDHKESLPGDSMLLFTGIKNFFKRKPRKSHTVPAAPVEKAARKSISMPKLPRGKFVIILPILALLFVGGVLFYFFKEKAVVTITVSPKSDTQNESVVFDASQGNDFSNNTIAGSTTTLPEDGTLQANATGTKQVGDKAKGSVTIYNSNTSPRTVPAGTTLTADNGLKFTLDKDTNVDAATTSGDIFSGIVTKPGNADASVTASDIGTEYNLPSGTKFAIGTTGTVVAKNANAFSGGTKKQVTVVSKDDESKLLDQLTKNLQDKAKNDMSNNANGDKVLLPIFVNTKVTKKSFDKNVNDQANSVTLTESMQFQGISYNKSDLQSYAENLEKNKVTGDMQLAPNGISTEVSDTKQKNDSQISATINVKAQLLPKIDTSKLIQTIKGESFDKAQNFLSNQPQVAHVDIALQPNIFFFPKMLPRNEKNITVVVNNQ